MSEEKIIEELKEGKLDSIEFIISKYAGSIKSYGMIHFYKIDQGLINDCVTDTFLSLIQNIEEFEYINQKTLGNWLFTTFKNIVYNEIKKKKTLKRGGGKFDINLDHEMEYIFKSEEAVSLDKKFVDQAFLEVLLSQLRTDEKAILWYYAKGFKNKEIAELIGISLSSLKSKKYRALCKLRELAKQYE